MEPTSEPNLDRLSRTLLEGLRNGCQLIARDWTYLYVNSAAAKHERTAGDALIGRTMMAAYPGIEQTRLFALIRDCMEQRTPRCVENELEFPDGHREWLELRIEPIPDGVAVLSVDITERKRAESALRHEIEQRRISEDRFRRLVENLEDVVFAMDDGGRITYVSPSVAKYGYAPDEVVGQAFDRFVSPTDLPALEGSLERLLAGHVETRVFRARDKQGKDHFVRTASRAILSDGRAVGISGVLVDITDLKRTEEKLRMAQKMEAIGQLAGGIAHDFNNLLAVILSYAELVSTEVRDRAEVHADVEEIQKAGERAAALTRQLLVFSRKQALELQVLDLNRLATDLERMLRRMIGEDIDLVKNLAADLGSVKADAGQMEQVIMNLVVNARDAMPHGGKLTIETANVDGDDAHEAARAPFSGPAVMLAITDSGTGMDETTKEHLFEPFFTTKEVGRGTGLGLSTVYGIVEQCSGTIQVHSELGVGTTFKIFLPRVSDAPRARGKDARRKTALGHETILLVEDDVGVRNLAVRVLRNAGYCVLPAANGTEAIHASESHVGKIDLLITDVVMPEISGQQLAERVTRARNDLRVLFISGYNDGALEGRGVRLGATLLPKPFTAEGLSSKVREALDAGARPVLDQ